MNKFSNCDSLKAYLNKETRGFNISIINVYNLFLEIYCLSKIEHSKDIIFLGL